MVKSVARKLNADYYYKTFKTYEHLVTLLYAIFNQCTSLKEVTTELLTGDQRIHHLGNMDVLAVGIVFFAGYYQTYDNQIA